MYLARKAYQENEVSAKELSGASEVRVARRGAIDRMKGSLCSISVVLGRGEFCFGGRDCREAEQVVLVKLVKKIRWKSWDGSWVGSRCCASRAACYRYHCAF